MANIENPPQNIKPQQKTEKRSWIDGNYKFETIRDKGIYKKTSLITGKVSYVAHVTNPHTGKQIKGTRCLLDERNPSADSRGVSAGVCQPGCCLACYRGLSYGRQRKEDVGTIMFASLNEIKTTVERSLPPDVVAALRHEGIALALTPSGDLGPIVTISDELAERELAGDMVSYRKNKTGIDNVIFISPKGYTRHAARIKVAIEPPHSLDTTTKTASIEISSGEVVAGELSDTQLLKQVQKFIELNRHVLIEYWNNKIATDELTERLKPVE